jgi:hypothetical protein
MGSKTYDGVRFHGFTDDHDPPHLHGFYAEVEVLVELKNGQAYLASRDDAIRPLNGKRSDVKYILKVAAKYADELVIIWRAARG